jgi:hypothetical protein
MQTILLKICHHHPELGHHLDLGHQAVLEVHPPPPPPSVAYKSRAEIEAWRNAVDNVTNPIKFVDGSDYFEYKYELDIDNAKSLFLSLVLAVPELLNQLILNYKFKDDGDEFSGVVDVATIDSYKTEFLNAMDKAGVSDEEIISLISVLSFICFGKLIAEWQHIIDLAGISSSDPRKFMCSVVLTVAGIGIEVNKDETNKEIWGRVDKVIKGVSIEFDPDNGILNVIVEKVFVQRHTHHDEYEGWLPSSFYTKYTRHGTANLTPVKRDSIIYWKDILFENYDTKKSCKSIVRYIASKTI